MNGDELLNCKGVVPLRTILTNFLNLVEAYEARRNGGLDSYDSEFQELKQFSENLKNDPDHVCREGEKNVNRKKNRYKDILPFDYTRVILSEYGDVPGCDYINANYIKGASGSSAYIASQGPLPHTVNDFWRMVVECEVQVIVMACNEQESGKHKCENYWVENDGVEREFGEVTVWLKKCRQVCPDFLVRTMRIRFTNSRGEKEERNVCQFHYSAWPDHGVPTKVRPLLDMVRLIRDRQTSETLPVLVHCSAGCGRTGTICAIDYVWGLLRLGRLTSEFSLFVLVREMRKQRIAMVQTKDQYILVHRAVKELFQEQLKIIDSHPYANVDENGLPLDLKKTDEPTYETLDFSKSLNSSLPFVSKKDSSESNGDSNEIVISVSNTNIDANNKLSASQKTPLPSSLTSTGGTTSSNHASLPSKISSPDPPSKIDKGSVKELSSRMKKYTENSIVDQTERDTIPEKEKKVTGVNENEQTKSSNLRSALLRKPSIVKLKSFFEKKPGQLSRAKSDVSSRFYSFNNFSSFGSNSHATPVDNQKSNSGDNQTISPVHQPAESSKEIKSVKKPPLFTKPTLPVKRSKSLKVPSDSTKLTQANNIYTRKDKKKVTEQNSNNGSVTSSNPSTSSSTFSSNVSENPIKVCVKQVEIPKLQTIVSKSVKPEVQMATTHEYDYDIDDRSHLRQKPINTIVLQREGFPKSSEPSSGGKAKLGDSMKHSFNMKPLPPSRVHIPRHIHNYANVAYDKDAKRSIPKEMEDLHSVKASMIPPPKYGKIKKCDTVNPRLLAASFGLTPKHERTSLTRSQSHVWQPDKVVLPIRIFSDENIHQSTKSEEPGDVASNISPSTITLDNNSSTPVKKSPEVMDSEVFIQAIHPDVSVKSVNADGYHSKKELQNGLNSSSENLLSAHNKPIVRRRVPKTNPYANYPSCITGSNNNFPYKVHTLSEDTPGGDRSEPSRSAKDMPSLKASNNGGSAGNSSDSSSNTGTPRNSLPSTPTQSVDKLYPQLHRTGPNASTKTSQNHRMNGLNLNQPKSILKESFLASQMEPEDKLDARTFPPIVNNPNQVPKINTIRIAVGVRERRNSFRQAVWKEAQPSSNVTDSLDQSGEATRNPLKPTYSSPFALTSNSVPTPVAETMKGHRNYEPIWPDSSNNHQINYYSSNPATCSKPSADSQTKADWRPPLNAKPATGSGSPYGILDSSATAYSDKHESGHQTNNKSNDRYEDQVFKHKVDEIQVMLAELNAPVGKLSDNSAVNAATTLKPHRSLRALSRSQYQQGLSCFTFKKPSSFESVVDQVRMEDDQQALLNSTNRNCQVLDGEKEKSRSKAMVDVRNASVSLGRHVNDYVTLQQCRTVDNSSAASFPSNHPFKSMSPEFENVVNGNSGSDIPVPPPRTKKNHYSPIREMNDYSTISNLEEESRQVFASPWSLNSAKGCQVQNERPGGVNQNNTMFASNHEGSDNFDTSSQEEQRSANTTSPKAIIKALGLFQAKAANVRSRFTNWAEAKDKNLGRRVYENGSRPQLENEASTGTDSSSFQACPGSSLQPSNQVPLGSVARSKHQYL
ncbi:unnamed protein product [Allacma fusca]|uniref:protein-tyrosine-phosphatase n=1 Tax=Allacma fusca TaxID=39272 RepID=A0A8J2JM89_9HEXA|nr:unnamed protein product [Allacma fusca]